MKYKVVLQKDEDGFTVTCPGLPGCISEGDSEAEALDNIRIAITEYLSVLRDELKGADVREIEVAV